MNETMFLYINGFAGKSHLLDLVGISLAKGMPYLFILIEIYLYFIVKKKNEAIFAFYAVIISLILNAVISLFYFHNRPFMDGIGTELIMHKPDNSFPSDHTTFLFAIAFSLMLFKIRYWGILLLLAFLGGVARVYVGVHYPYDILGGIISGLFGASMIYLMKNKLTKLNEFIYKIEFLIFRNKI